MAAVTAAAITAGLGIYQVAKGASDKGKYENTLKNLQAPELDNPSELIPIATSGSDLIREESARTTASLVDSARAGGATSVMSSVPKIIAENNRIAMQGRKYLDDQIINRSHAIAQDERQNKRIKEMRYQSDVDGLGNAIATADQNMWNGLRGIGSAASGMARMSGGGDYNFDSFGSTLPSFESQLTPPPRLSM